MPDPVDIRAGREFKTPIPTYRDGNVQVPVRSLLWFLGVCLVAGAGLVTKYIYATKDELSEHAKVESERVTVVEQTEKHHNEAINEVKSDVKDVKESINGVELKVNAVESNVRTVLQEIGVSANRIAKPRQP